MRDHRQQMEYPSCHLCGADTPEKMYAFPPFEVVRCRFCSLGYLSPRLEEKAVMALYRDPGYFQGESGGGYDNYLGQEAGLRHTFRGFLRILSRKGLTGGALLDVGCGPGLFLDEAKRYFAYRVGTEYCPEIARNAATFADRIVIGGLDDLAGERFDIVTGIGVLEHVYDPIAFLVKILPHLREEGAVVLVTPNVDGFWRRFFRRRWPSFKIPEHVTYFSPKTLGHLAERSGFRCEDMFGYTEVFPLSLILKKMSIVTKVSWCERVLLPVPATMVCAVFRNANC
jgi:SAM-dependent methyltransferase